MQFSSFLMQRASCCTGILALLQKMFTSWITRWALSRKLNCTSRKLKNKTRSTCFFEGSLLPSITGEELPIKYTFRSFRKDGFESDILTRAHHKRKINRWPMKRTDSDWLYIDSYLRAHRIFLQSSAVLSVNQCCNVPFSKIINFLFKSLKSRTFI